jgi:hypothetical protein
LGRLKADRGEIENTIALFQQFLALKEQIGDVQGKAVTLSWLGQQNKRVIIPFLNWILV